MKSRSEVHHANHYTIEASCKKGQIFHVEAYNVLLFGEVKVEMHVTYNEWILTTCCIEAVSPKCFQTPFVKFFKVYLICCDTFLSNNGFGNSMVTLGL